MTVFERQIRVPCIGNSGQAKLSQSRATVIGAGGLGFPIISYLAAAGIGTIRIIEHDTIGWSNLNRQLFFTPETVGEPKLLHALKWLQQRFPHTKFEEYNRRLTDENYVAALGTPDIIIDAVDNLETRYLLNNASLILQVPTLFNAVEALQGFQYLFDPSDTAAPCYECIFPKKEFVTPSDPVPIIGATAGVVGSLAALRTIQFLIDRTQKIPALSIDLSNLSITNHPIKRRPTCPAHERSGRTEASGEHHAR